MPEERRAAESDRNDEANCHEPKETGAVSTSAAAPVPGVIDPMDMAPAQAFAVCPVIIPGQTQAPNLFSSVAEAQKWLSLRANSLSEPGSLVTVSAHNERWCPPIPIRNLREYPQASPANASITAFLPVTIKELPESPSLDDKMEAFFGDRSAEIVCFLGEDWQFELVAVSPRVAAGLCGLVEQEGSWGVTLQFTSELENGLNELFPDLSLAAVADFWRSWQVHKQLADFCYVLGRSKTAINLAGHTETAERSAQKAWDFTSIQIAAFAHRSSARAFRLHDRSGNAESNKPSMGLPSHSADSNFSAERLVSELPHPPGWASSRPEICFDRWDSAPDNHPLALRVGQMGFYLSNDGTAAHEVQIERFEIDSSVWAAGELIARIPGRGPGFVLVWLEGHSPSPLAVEKWDLLGAMRDAAKQRGRTPFDQPDYSVKLNIRYRDSQNHWYLSSANLKYVQSQDRLKFEATTHEICRLNLPAGDQEPTPIRPGIAATRQVLSVGSVVLKAATNGPVDDSSAQKWSGSNLQTTAKIPGRRHRKANLETSRERVGLAEVLARELATIKSDLATFCTPASLRSKYPSFVLWDKLQPDELKDIANGVPYAPKAYGERIALRQFGNTSRETLKKDRAKLRKAARDSV
jgi:hypothetical protein